MQNEIQNVELADCLTWLTLHEADEHGFRKTEDEVAEAMGLTVEGLRVKITHWQSTGIADQARRQYLVPKLENILLAQIMIIDEMPALLRSLVEKAKDSQSPLHALEIVKFLHSYVEPRMNDNASETSEQAYIRNMTPDSFDPTGV